jgi:hypothetical protein
MVAIESQIHIPRVDLLAPEHSGKGLALNVPVIGCRPGRLNCRVELIGLGFLSGDDWIDFCQGAANPSGLNRSRRTADSPAATRYLYWIQDFVPVLAGFVHCSPWIIWR